MKDSIESSVEEIRIVPPSRQYWLVRTYSGITFNDYYEKGYVGIGYNSIPIDRIKIANKDDVSKNSLKLSFQQNYNSSIKESTRWSNQLISFYHDIKIGDYVVIPDENSDWLAIGEVTSKVIQVIDERTFRFKDKNEPFPAKRRKVKWLSVMNRHEYNYQLGGMVFIRQPITNVNEFQNVFESHVSSLFIVGNKANLSIQINREQEINAFDFRDFLDSMIYLYEELCIENDEPVNRELYLKIKVQSLGEVLLTGAAIIAVLGLATMFALSDDPSIDISYGKFRFKASSKGFLKSYDKFLNSKQKRLKTFEKMAELKHKLEAERKKNKDLKEASKQLKEASKK